VSLASEGEGNAGAGLRKADTDFSELLFRACHDLRSPSRSIQTTAQLITRDPANAHLSEGLGIIIDSARRLDSLIDRLASYSIALQTEPASFQPVRMDVCLRTALASLHGEITARNAGVASRDLPRVSGDADRLTQVFEELLGNALQHGGAKTPRIEIAADQRGDEWIIAVRDNGSGIPDESFERIFRPFEKLGATHGAGSGMGLTICRMIVERHGGRLWAEAGRDSGVAFLFTLPALP
jgi:signal transduction histidine kinase